MSIGLLYIAPSHKRQYLNAAFVLLTVCLGACSQFSGPISTNDLTSDVDVTGSIKDRDNGAFTNFAPGDLAVMAEAIGDVLNKNDSNDGQSTWQNTISGNNGSITSATKTLTQNGGACIDFATTANTISGVAAYIGLACQDVAANWRIIQLAQKTEAPS